VAVVAAVVGAVAAEVPVGEEVALEAGRVAYHMQGFVGVEPVVVGMAAPGIH
jgi:hypothetical protein